MRKRLSLTSAVIAAMTVSNVQAQVVEEIVVTAQRRAENVQDVPIAITGFSNTTMEEGRIQTTQDLQFHVPSLNFGYLSVFSKVYLRGIGTDITSQGADGAVATYIDGIYVPGQSSQIQGLLGTERIEVLAGPQGTLYGRNAVAGAINIYSLTPSEETSVKVSLGAGDYDRREATGHFSGGVTDTLFVGVYGGYIERDSYHDIINVNAPQFGMQNDMHKAITDDKQYGARLKAVSEPNDDLKVTASFDYTELEGVEGGIFRNLQANALAYGFEPYQQQNGDGSVFQFIPGYQAGIQEYLPNAPRLTPGKIKKHRYETNLPSYSVQIQRLGVLRFDYDLSNDMRLVSLTGYLDHVGQGADDVDATAAPIFGSTSRDWGQTDDTFSQEFQLLAPPDAKYQWILGLYYMDQNSAFEPNDSYGIVAAGIFGPDLLDRRFLNYGYANAQSYAAYGQSTFPLDNLAEGLRLTAGARYTHDAKEYEKGETYTKTPAGQQLTGTFPSQDDTWNDFSIKLTLDYKVADNTLLYVTYAEGYRAGLYNLSAPQDVLRDGALDPEELTDYEIGSKSDFMEGRVRLNTAAWFYKFDNIQVNRVTSTGGAGSGIAATIQNAASAETYGAEATLAFAATDRLSLASGLTYIHSEYTDFKDANAIDINTSPLYAPNANVVVDATGNQLVRSPKWVVTANIDYRMPLANGELQFDVSGYYNDGYFFNSTNDLKQPSYEMVDAFIRYSWNDRFSVKLWGKNLTDKFFYTELQNLVNIIAQDGVPRHWGLSFTYEM